MKRLLIFLFLLPCFSFGQEANQDSVKNKNTVSPFIDFSIGFGKTYSRWQRNNQDQKYSSNSISLNPVSIEFGGMYKRFSACLGSKLSYRYGVSFKLTKPVEKFYQYYGRISYTVFERKFCLTPFVYGGSFRNKYNLWGSSGGSWDNKYDSVDRALLLGAGMQTTFNQHGKVFYGCKFFYEFIGLTRTESESNIVYPNTYIQWYPELTYNFHNINFSLFLGFDFPKK